MKPMQLYIPKEIVELASARAGEQKVGEFLLQILRLHLSPVYMTGLLADGQSEQSVPIWGSIPAPAKTDA